MLKGHSEVTMSLDINIIAVEPLCFRITLLSGHLLLSSEHLVTHL